MSTQENILVIKLSALGDFIQSLGPMKAIRDHHPKANITLLTTKPFKNIAEKSNYFNNIIIDERPKFHQFKKWFSLRKKLNFEKITRVYDLQNNDRTSIYFKLFKPKPEWVGIAKGASHRNTSPDRKSSLAFYGHQQTLALAGIKDVQIDNLDWMNTDIGAFNLSDNYALIVPGCAPTRPEKRWPQEHYATLAHHLADIGLQPVILGTNDEKDITDYIAKHCKKALNLGGKTSLFDIAALGRSAKIAIGNDTGPMHMIAPTGCPSLVLFSKNSDPKRHAPLGHDVQTLQKDDLKDLQPEEVIQKINL